MTKQVWPHFCKHERRIKEVDVGAICLYCGESEDEQCHHIHGNNNRGDAPDRYMVRWQTPANVKLE